MPIPLGVLWDYGDTLENHSESEWHVSEEELFGELHATLRSARIERTPDEPAAFRAAMRRAWDDWTRDIATHLREIQVAEIVGQALGYDGPTGELRERLQELVDRMAQKLPAHPTFPDTVPSLRRLRAAGLRQGLVSNTLFSEAVLRHFLKHNGLLEYLDCVVSSADHGRIKPHPSIFALGLAGLGLAAAETVFVGDSLPCDVRGAQGIGMRAIWLRNGRDARPGEGENPDAICDSRTEAVATILRWRDESSR